MFCLIIIHTIKKAGRNKGLIRYCFKEMRDLRVERKIGIRKIGKMERLRVTGEQANRIKQTENKAGEPRNGIKQTQNKAG